MRAVVGEFLFHFGDRLYGGKNVTSAGAAGGGTTTARLRQRRDFKAIAYGEADGESALQPSVRAVRH